MPNRADRRRFLCRSALWAGAGLLGGGITASRLQAIEPIQRDGKSFFKFSLAAYSYRDLLDAKDPKKKLSLNDFVADCAKMRLDGTELTSYYFPPEPSAEYLRQLKQLCFRLGLDISGTAVGNDFCHPPGETRDREIRHVKQWVEAGASIVGGCCGTTPDYTRRMREYLDGQRV